ncbi:MAG: mechanosensitive ion channel family protein [Patescibacteria group bacterium]|nr:mechanosensitive ion channel family protein [Patescibacteria group bacterium]
MNPILYQLPSLSTLTEKIFFSLVYFLFGYLIVNILTRLLNNLIFKIKRINNRKLLKKTQTLKPFIDSIISAVIYFGVIIYVLSLWNINLTPFLTGAGIVGLAFSFGAQSLIKDLISGFFIIFDDQFEVGDYVRIGSYEGKVTKITLRQIVLRDREDNTIIIPNSQINGLVKIKKTD